MTIDRKIFNENVLLINHFDLRGQGVFLASKAKLLKPRQFRLGYLIVSQDKQFEKYCFISRISTIRQDLYFIKFSHIFILRYTVTIKIS